MDGVIENELKHILDELAQINRHLAELNSKTATAAEKIAIQQIQIHQNTADIESMKPELAEIKEGMAARVETVKVFERMVTDVNSLVAWMNQQKGGFRASHLIGSVVVGLVSSIGTILGVVYTVQKMSNR